jgi:hypothetical protein
MSRGFVIGRGSQLSAHFLHSFTDLTQRSE